MRAFGLLHQRLLGDPPPPPSGIVDPMTFPGAYSDADAAFDPDAAHAGALIRIKSDGTWYMEKEASGISSPLTGDWSTAPAPGIGAGFSVRFTETYNSGDLGYTTVNNDGGGAWIAVGSDREWSIDVTIPSNDSTIVEYDLLVEIRNDSTMDVVSKSIAFTISADQEA